MLLDLVDFSKQDWSVYPDAEYFDNGDSPKIAITPSFEVVVDRMGVRIVFEDDPDTRWNFAPGGSLLNGPMLDEIAQNITQLYRLNRGNFLAGLGFVKETL